MLANVGFGAVGILARGDALGCAKRELLVRVTVAGLSSLINEPSESSATPAWSSATERLCSPLALRVAPEM